MWEYPALCGPAIGIEASLHVLWAIWPQSAGWTKDGASVEEDDGDLSGDTTLWSRICTKGVLTPGTNPRAAEDATFSRYKPETGFGSALFDARNGFNEINHYLILIGKADLHSTSTGPGSSAWSGQNRANQHS